MCFHICVSGSIRPAVPRWSQAPPVGRPTWTSRRYDQVSGCRMVGRSVEHGRCQAKSTGCVQMEMDLTPYMKAGVQNLMKPDRMQCQQQILTSIVVIL